MNRSWGEKLGGVTVRDSARWTLELAEGDKVIVHTPGGITNRDTREIKTVEKVSETRVTVGGTPFNKADACARGSSRMSLEQATPEAMARVRAANERRRLESALYQALAKLDRGSMMISGRYPSLDNDQISRILAIIAEPPKCETCTGKPAHAGGPLIDCSGCGATGVHKGG